MSCEPPPDRLNRAQGKWRKDIIYSMKKTDLKTANYSHRSDSADVSPDSSEIKLIKIMSKFVLLSGGFQRDCDKEQILQKSSLCSRESEQSNYENNIDQTNQGDVSSHQELKDLHKEENALGYGCIRFSDTSSCDHAQPYIRIPMPEIGRAHV